ncbi:hypothetical protein GDO81_023722 [Engystomops pustulosus]|uniref:Secreted protein n=1 Tax=Engystomops pustulosus TaxID=76066 RepID=A0AAV6ZNI6_ENGPU|nr:hypothetical protein GDO81_023722 [Engystomops pustulosus]
MTVSYGDIRRRSFSRCLFGILIVRLALITSSSRCQGHRCCGASSAGPASSPGSVSSPVLSAGTGVSSWHNPPLLLDFPL